MIMKGKMRSTEIRQNLLSFYNIPSTLTIKDNVYCIQNGFCQNVVKIVEDCRISPENSFQLIIMDTVYI